MTGMRMAPVRQNGAARRVHHSSQPASSGRKVPDVNHVVAVDTVLDIVIAQIIGEDAAGVTAGAKLMPQAGGDGTQDHARRDQQAGHGRVAGRNCRDIARRGSVR